MTEWDVEYVQGQRRLRRVLELADTEKLSWIGWQYKQYARVAGSPPHGSLIDPRTGVYRPGMCKLFSRPYPVSVAGELVHYHFNWTTSLLHVTVKPPPTSQAEIFVTVTEEDDWGWDGEWVLKTVSRADGEHIGHVRVEREEDLERSQSGIRWWVERAWVEGSKLVKIRLGDEWRGEARLVIGMEGSAAVFNVEEWGGAQEVSKDLEVSYYPDWDDDDGRSVEEAGVPDPKKTDHWF